jgi:tetratricopeptide (TPR) repeat protein
MRRVAALLLVLAAAYALDRWTLLPLGCAHAAGRGSRALEANSRRAATVRESLRDCESAEALFIRAGASRLMGDPRAAIADYRRALDLDRRPETYFGLGLAELDVLDRPAAIDAFMHACAFDPARLADIPYDDVRRETERRVRAAYGDAWLR